MSARVFAFAVGERTPSSSSMPVSSWDEDAVAVRSSAPTPRLAELRIGHLDSRRRRSSGSSRAPLASSSMAVEVEPGHRRRSKNARSPNVNTCGEPERLAVELLGAGQRADAEWDLAERAESQRRRPLHGRTIPASLHTSPLDAADQQSASCTSRPLGEEEVRDVLVVGLPAHPWCIRLRLCARCIGAGRVPHSGRREILSQIRTLLDVSSLAIGVMYVGLLLLLIGGIAAGIVGERVSTRVGSGRRIVILVVITVAMLAMATPVLRAAPRCSRGPGKGPEEHPNSVVKPAKIDVLAGSNRPGRAARDRRHRLPADPLADGPQAVLTSYDPRMPTITASDPRAGGTGHPCRDCLRLDRSRHKYDPRANLGGGPCGHVVDAGRRRGDPVAEGSGLTSRSARAGKRAVRRAGLGCRAPTRRTARP